jgi:threonine 3-dehydrogenase
VGARNIVITDINPYRLELARKMGATRAVDTRTEDLASVMKDLGMTEGFDVGLEMSGNASAFRSMIGAMVNGGRVAVLGIFPGEVSLDWSKIVFKGLFIKGIYGREMYETWYKMAAMVRSGLDITKVITHHFPIAEFKQGFEVMGSGQSGKVVLDWSK